MSDRCECHGCGLEVNVRCGTAICWCDECYCELMAKLARMQPVICELGKYIRDLRGGTRVMDIRWLVVSEAWDKYEEGG